MRNARRPAVANISSGTARPSEAYNRAAQALMNSGVPMAVSAGNSNDDTCNHSPAGAAGLLTVGATDLYDRRWSSSSWGRCVSLFAPGKDIDSADSTSTSGFTRMNGTSMASPHVAGVAALMLADEPGNPGAVRQRLLDAATRDIVGDPGQDSPNLLLYNGYPRGSLSTVSRTANNLDAFKVGHDGKLYTSWWSHGYQWSGKDNNWFSLGGDFRPDAEVTALTRAEGKLDVFVVAKDGSVHTRWWSEDQGWSSSWRQISGAYFVPGAKIAAVARTPRNIDLFGVTGDGRVFASWWSEGNDWSGVDGRAWLDVGGWFPAGSHVSAVSRQEEKLDLFVTGYDGHVHTAWWAGGGWSQWGDLGGSFPAGVDVSAVARTRGNLDLFATGRDGRVHTAWWSEGNDWSGWRSIGGNLPAGATVTVVSRGTWKLDLFAVAHDGRMYTTWWSDTQDWPRDWRQLGGDFPAGAPVSVNARTGEHLDAFATGRDGAVMTTAWSTDHDWLEPFSIGGWFPA